MSDKFFDKDNNFILWKDKGDLTKASKYVGDNRSSIGVGESLVTKIAKGKIDINRTYGMVDSDSLEVNWGKCGGTEDVIVTYNEGDDLWIPNAFFRQAFKDNWEPVGTGSSYYHGEEVGYRGGDIANGYILYNLPQELGKYLYDNAESITTGTGYYGGTNNWNRAYKGIAIYPDHIGSDTSTDWGDSPNWGIGIRTKSDVGINGHDSSGNTVESTSCSNLKTGDCYNNMVEGKYYMIVQCTATNMSRYDNTSHCQGWMQRWNVNDNGTDHTYLRHFKGMSSAPTSTNQGSKYTCPKSICKKRGIIERALTVNWGKCGGSSDVIVTYGEGEPLWVPYAFIRNAFDSSLVPKTNIFDKQIGYQGLLGDNHVSGYDEAIYKLPSNIGSYLYANAETGTGYDGSNSSNLYKGIAFYPDTVSTWEKGTTMGIGIRKKSDIGKYSTIQSDVTVSSTISSNLEDDAYYLVAQINKTTADNIIVLNGHLNSCFPLTSDNGVDHLYLRHWVDMDAVPSATNMGEKYTCPSELCSDMTIYTETKDSITVNWGKCGGNEDIIVKYNVGDPIWVPKAFFTQAPMRTSTSGVNSTIPDIGYIGKFAYSYPSESSKYVGIVYRLPQNLGELLYNNSESGDAYGNYIASSRYYGALWNGIAIYPDNPSSWGDYSNGWGVAIRKGSEIGIMKKLSDGSIPTMYTYDITSEPFYQYINTNDYYLVAEDYNSSSNKYAISGMLDLFGDNTIYFRHWKTMSSTPSADNKGEKYTVTLDMVTTYHSLPTPNEDQVVIDWGGGVKTYYKYGEPMYIPRAFLMEAFDGVDSSNKAIHRPDNIGNHVGYQYWGGSSIVVYRLPDEIGEYLYNCAESWAVGENLAYNCTGTELGHMADGRLYKGIAMYPDESHNLSYSFTFGIGIRKKNDIIVSGFNADGTQKTYAYGNSLLDDDAYYLVAQSNTADSSTSYYQLYSHLSNCFPKEEVLWLRHWKGMTAIPNGTTVMGKKMLYGVHELGGKLFYIDSSNNGATYTFYDGDGVKINSWSTISDLANAKYYSVKGAPSKDKFYVYYPTNYSSLKWWDNNNTTTGATGTAIGTGKTNTSTVMSRSDLPTSGTIWNKLSEVRTSSGISDWFVPSKDEIDRFRSVNLESWSRGDNWSSYETSASQAYQSFATGSWLSPTKTGNGSVFFIRSF